MVIAHVLSSFQVGGQERMALELGARQRARGHEVLAVSLAPGPEGPLAEELRGAGIAAHTVARWGPTVDPTLPVRLGVFLRRARVEVVHAHNPQPLLYAGLAGKLAGAAVIQTRHGVAIHSAKQDWLVRKAARLADASVFVSRELAARLGGAGQAAGRRWVIENGVDLTRFHPDASDRSEVRRALGIADDALVVGTVSRLAASKNVPGLVRALRDRLGEGMQVVIVGDGEDAPALEALLAGTAADRFVHRLGARDDVARLLRAFDLFALFSRTEGHPMVVLEAMASGLPVVATRVGGVPGIIDDGETGLLVEPDDEAALARAVGALAEDETRRREMGRRARVVVAERYPADRMVDEYLALYARWGGRWRACSAW
jgi:glycosyltransferase involved in cell wall biosynthesis